MPKASIPPTRFASPACPSETMLMLAAPEVLPTLAVPGHQPCDGTQCVLGVHPVRTRCQPPSRSSGGSAFRKGVVLRAPESGSVCGAGLVVHAPPPRGGARPDQRGPPRGLPPIDFAHGFGLAGPFTIPPAPVITSTAPTRRWTSAPRPPAEHALIRRLRPPRAGRARRHLGPYRVMGPT